MDAYCVKCHEKREILEPVADFNAAGTPVTHGVCGVCGTKLFRMGSTPAHAGLTPPDRTPKPILQIIQWTPFARKLSSTQRFFYRT